MDSAVTSAIFFIDKDAGPQSGSFSRKTPSMLESLLFAAPARWCAAGLERLGITRFLVVVCQPDYLPAAKECFSADTTFLLASQPDAQEGMNKFLEETQGRLVIFTKPVLFYYSLQNAFGSHTPPPGPARHGGYLVSAHALSEEMADTDMGAALEKVGTSLDPFVTPIPSDPAGRAAAGEQLRQAVNERWMDEGVTLVDPKATYIGPDVTIQPGTVLLPGTILRGTTHIGPNCELGPHTMLTDAEVGEGVTINSSQCVRCSIGDHTTVGPFAYLRPGTQVGPHVRVGDFVELKNSTIGEGAKIAHLAYLGDSDVGARTDIGCGTVTVNFDGEKKFRTKIGDGAFIGCNTNLVAPVTVGQGSYVAAGSTITRDVPSESLAIARAQQTIKNKWVQKHKKND